MRSGVTAVNLDFVSWRADWVWGLPLIVLTVVIHVLTLGFINERGIRVFSRRAGSGHHLFEFVAVMGTTTVYATTLHAIEAGFWAASYRLLGALPDFQSAMLYSLSAITSYGHEKMLLQARWQLLGAIEALNGCLLFGLTTAFLFGMIQKVWSLSKDGRARGNGN
jgi:hypothetical protein